MDDTPQPPPPPGEPPVLSYARPAQAEPPRGRFGSRSLVNWLAVGWFFAMVFAGVSSDRIRIPLSKKIILTAGACAIAAALCMRGTDTRPGCVVWFILGAFAFLGVMWFWN